MLDYYDKYNNEVVNWVNEWIEEPKNYSTERILFIGDSVTRGLCSYIRKYGFANKECLVDLLACSVPIDATFLEHFKEVSHFKERPYKNIVLFVTRHMRKYKIEEYEEYVRGLLYVFEKWGGTMLFL